MPLTASTARGFTGHEHIDLFELVNMNGRVYDPILGMFLSPDNYVQDPTHSQSFNRNSYCLGNPLLYIDPDGYWFGYDDLVVAIVGAGVGYVSYGLATGNWGKKAFAAATIGAAVAWVSWNTMGAGTIALNATGGAGTATSFSSGVSAVFGSSSGHFGYQFALLSVLNILTHKKQLSEADKKGWNGVWAAGAYMAASVLSTSLKPFTIGSENGGFGLRQFVGVVLTDNLSDNFTNGEFDLHSVHIGPVGYDWKYRDDKTWGGIYTIFSKGLTNEQRFQMGFEMVLGLSLIKSNIVIPKYKWSTLLVRSGRFVKMPHVYDYMINTAKIGYYSKRILDISDIFFIMLKQKTTIQYWYDTNFNEDGTFKD
ncbi:MAG TPA: RHS repeat-associated core domain-containing protein [Bacteroidales bacterium]|nr:RHS repeat-associated core domain-containing protein [Bacteroidales bacterium]HPO66692.1 RHS repeat-associated core domain-containing protein [Bacteroidales bacterium]